jgi:hypothetical protein
MAQNLGWRSFWWLNTALLAFASICCVFLFPETKFNRNFMPQNSTVSSSPPLKSGSAEQVEETPAQNGTHTEAVDHTDPEKDAPVQAQNPVVVAGNDANLSHVHTHKDPWLGRGKPSKAQWRLWQPYEGNFFMELWMPWYLSLFPIVEFSAFVVSWTASSFLTLNLTQSQAFAAPPYNFTSTKIGFFNFAILIGALIGLFTAGPLSDFVAARLTKRNRGIREPEMRLLAMVPYVILMIIGNVVVAVGYQHQWDWKVSQACPSPEFSTLTSGTGDRHHRLHLCWDSGRSSPVNLLNLLHRFLQTRRRLNFRCHHGQQERLGLRILEVHHPMDHQERLHTSHHDEHELDHPLVFDRNHFLVLRQNLQEVDQRFESPHYVNWQREVGRGSKGLV